MISNSLIKKVKQVSESIHEVSWYLNEYKDSDEHPFEKFIYKLFLDLDIKLPPLISNDNKQLILGFAILTCNYELEQDSIPGSYRFFTEEFGYLDEIRDVDDFSAEMFASIIHCYYQANNNNEIEKLYKVLNNTTLKWNWSAYVKQEEVKSLINQYSLSETSHKAHIPEYDIPRILDDYYSRINLKRIENLDSFLNKSHELISSENNYNQQTQFFNQIIEEVKNGGKNLKSIHDIIPHYSGIKFN